MTTRDAAPPSACEVVCFADTDLVTTSFATTALIELAHAGQIRLRWRLRDLRLRGVRSPFTVWCHVRELPRGAWRRVCFDLHDADTHLDLACLRAADRYFKMNLSERSRERAPAEDRGKLEPFGPATACRPVVDERVGLRWFGGLVGHALHQLALLPQLPSWLDGGKHVLRQLTRTQRYAQRMTWPQFEADDTGDLADSPVFFNPSCWPEANAQIAAVNAFRAEVIVRLRERLGSRFAGGFRDSTTARERYPQAIEDRSYSSDEYLARLHRSPLAIYTNGLTNAFSWRLYENFAAGKCVVSEPIPNEPGFPLDRGAGIVVCATPEGLVEEVVRLLAAPAERAALAEAARETYRSRLQPLTRMQRLLGQVLGAPVATAVAAPSRDLALSRSTP